MTENRDLRCCKITDLLMEAHSSQLNGLPFNFGLLLQKLVKKRSASAEIMLCMIRAQRKYFSDVDIDWQRILNQSIEDKVPIPVFVVLVESSLSWCLVCMSPEQKKDIERRVNALDCMLHHIKPTEEEHNEIQMQVTNYVRQYKEYSKEITSILEPVLWRNVMEEVRESHTSKDGHSLPKRAKISHLDFRLECPKACPAKVVIPNVLSFL